MTDLYKNVLVLVPPDAFLVLDDGDQDLVQDVGTGLAERVVRLAPPGHYADLWEKSSAF